MAPCQVLRNDPPGFEKPWTGDTAIAAACNGKGEMMNGVIGLGGTLVILLLAGGLFGLTHAFGYSGGGSSSTR